MTVYYKIRQILLQNATAILLQNTTKVYDKTRQVFYHKMRQLVENATIIINCDSTLSLGYWGLEIQNILTKLI